MLSHDQKETALEAIKSEGTMQAGAKVAGVSVKTLNNEMKRSAIFKKRVLEAREEGKRNMSDQALQLVKDYAYGKYDKTDRNRLTAALALLNWAEPGFRGTSQIQGKIEHDIRVITAVPRPKYEVSECMSQRHASAPLALDNPPKKLLKSGKRTKKIDIRDEQGNYIGTQTVSEAMPNLEEVIKGEVNG